MDRSRIFILFLVVASTLCVISLRRAGSQSTGLRRITNTTEEGISINPSISGDGRIVAFESTEDIAGTGGSDHFRAIGVNISTDPASFFDMGGTRAVTPAISQDGSRIAFASKDDPLGANPDGNSEIFLFDGARLIQLTNTSPGDIANRVTNGNFQPSMSDDGRFIAFSSNRDFVNQNSDGNLEIFIYDMVATTFTQLTNSSGIVGAGDAKISGNGATVAYVRDLGATTSTKRDLMIQDRLSGPATALASQVQSLRLTYGRAISDDGARVVFSSEIAMNSSQVFLYDGRSGGIIRQITSLGVRVTEVPLHPTISGDGGRIAFAARRSVPGAANNSDGSVELYVFDSPTATFSRITNAPSSATAEVVSSLNDDGSIVAFNFPRVLSGAVVNSDSANNSEIYATAPPARPALGALTAIINDASFGHEPSAVKAVAPDSIAFAQGNNLANTAVQSQRLPNGTFPTKVAGTSVTVNGRAAQLFFVSPAQVNFLMPPQTEIGTANVVVTNAEDFPSQGSVATLRAAPGIFTRSGDGVGEGIILNADTLQQGPFDSTGGNLRLAIFSTGARNASVTTVTIGGRTVPAEAVIASADMPGLDEVHVRVPADLRGAGPVNLSVQSDARDSNPVTVTFTGDFNRSVFINEVLADPPDGIAGDANHDGVRNGTDDEFVELVNGTSTETIGMSGWTIKTRATGSTTETTRFTFASGTSLSPGQAIVVFGGGNFNPLDGVFGCTQVVKATTSSGLSLTNSGLTIMVRDSAGNLITQFTYGGSAGLNGDNNESLTRSPDITGNFVGHTSAAGANGRRFSPGLKVDGTPFGSCPRHLASVIVTPSSTSVGVGQSTQFMAQASDQYGAAMPGVTFNFASDNPTVATIDSVSTNSAAGTAIANVSGHNPGTAHITATGNDGTNTVNSNQATLTVTGPSLSISDVSQSEGDTGTTTFNFTVGLNQPAGAGGVKFDIATQDGTATVADSDYLTRSLTNQTIPAGQSTYNFAVTVNGDTKIEPNETFFVNVTNVNGASVLKAQGVGTILNDDSPVLSINDVSANEGNSGTTTFTFAVTSTLPAPAPGITFDIATADASATAASGDYVARSLTSQTIPTGRTTYTFNVTVNGDTLVEPDESFFVNISNVSSNASVSDAQGQGTVKNDDVPNLVISQVYGGGGNTGATFKNDFIELYNRGTTTIDLLITPYSVQYAGVGSNFGTDRTNVNSGAIAPGKYFLIQEAAGSGGTTSLPTPDATGTIALTAGSGKVALVLGTTALSVITCPGDDGSSPFNPNNANIADFVGYGSATTTAGHCYEGSGPAPAPSNNTADFRKAGGCVDTNDNTSDFLAAPPNPRNSSSPLGDCKPEISINDVTKNEGNTGTTAFTLTVSLSVASAQTVTVDYATADGTATAPTDYQSTSGTLTFNPGDLTKTINVLVNGDTTNEPNETFFVNLSNATNGVFVDNQGLGTITNDDAQPSLSINDVTVTEGDGGTTPATFTVSLSAASGFTVTVNYATADNTATAGSDYQSTSGTLTFNPGETTKPVTVLVNGDTTFEQNETFFVNLTSPTNATISDSQGQGTITNDDPVPPTPTLFINDVSLAEGNSGTSVATFNVTLLPASGQTVTVDFATANGTATTAGNDYQSASGTLTFNPGDTSKPIDVTINGDTLVEPDETFFVNLTSATGGANIGDPQGQGTIQNDDTANLGISQVYGGGDNTGAPFRNDFVELYNRGTTTVDFGATPYSIQYASVGSNFSSSNKTNLTTGTLAPGHYFLIQESGGTTNGVALPTPDATGSISMSSTSGKVALVVGTAALAANSCPGDDSVAPFNPNNSSIADFVGYGSSASNAGHCYEGTGPAAAPSNTTADFRKAGGCVDTNDNTADFLVAPPNPRNSSSPIGDCKPEISISDVTKNEGNSATTTFTFTVSLSAASTQTVTVDFATADGTATAPSDYQSTSGTLTFNPGDLTKTINVLVNGDTTNEPNETFFVNLSNAANAVFVDNQGLGTITNDDAQPSLSINDVTVTEGDSGTTPATFTVSLSAASGFTVTVNYATADNSATAGSDYQSTSGTLTFSPGETSKPVTVLVNGDTTFEQNETFFVNLTSPTNATISDSQGQGTINNDDPVPPTPTLFINDVSLAEGNSGTSVATFNVTLSAASGQTVTVDFATANGTATTAGNDYQSATGTLTFNPGDTSKPINVTINGDTLVEPDETFFVNISSPSAGTTISGSGQGTGTIQNDDGALVVISQVYGGGGNSGASYKNDFIEIFNRSIVTVDLSGYSVHEISDTGTGTWSLTPICPSGPCLVSPGKYFLVQEAAGAGGTQNLPTPDATGTINLGSTAAKVALVSNVTALSGGCPSSTAILDLVGYGTTASCFEGSGKAPAPSNTTADFRKSGGCVDTNDNAADFVTSAPNPRNSASAANDCSTGFRPDITINDVTVTEGDAGTVNATFTVTLSAASTQTVTVAYATADGTATAPADYQSTSGTLTFSPGMTTQPITVLVNGDLLDEPNETFFVNLTNATNASILDPQGLGTINDNDPTPSLSINDLPNIPEGDSGTSIATFTVTLSAASGQTVTVDFATADGTATAGSDYVATSGTLTFNPGDTTKTIPVTINGDTTVEPDETFFVNLSNVSATATIFDAQGQGTIKNDDIAPSADLSVSKSASPSVVVVPGNNITYAITVTNNGPTSATNAVMDDSTPPNTTFQSMSVPPGWTCITPAVNGTGSVHCTKGTLTVQSQNFSLVVKVNSGTPLGTTIMNTATISSDTPDSNSANNSSTTNTNVVAAGSADLAITKSDSPDPVGIGNDLTYTIVLTNNGPASAANISVSDNLPSQVTFRSIGVPASWTCMTPAVGANGSITCTAASLAAGATATFPLVVRVNTSVTDGTVISNTVNVTTTTTDSIASNNSATTTTTAKAGLLVISQVYGGGGNSSATYTNDFIEIFNRGTTTIDFSLTPYSVQYASATSNFSTNKTDIISGTLLPGHYYLIQEASGGAVGSALPTPDVSTGTINLSATAGKVALVLGTTALTGSGCPFGATIVDFVGYGSPANCSETSPTTPNISGNATSVSRKSNGCQDTGNNSSDFTNTSPPTPRNNSSPANVCP